MYTKQATTGGYLFSRGAAALTCVTLLLMLTTLAGSFGASITRLNLKVALNAQHKLRINELAVSRLNSEIIEIQTKRAQLQDTEQQRFDELHEYQISHRLLNDNPSEPFSLVGLSTSVTATDSGANATQSHIILYYSLLDAIPAAPLIVDGAIWNSDKLTIVANPNGAGPNIPVSVWTSAPLNNLSALPTSCQQFEFSQTNCINSALTQPGYKGTDIVDVSQAFPEDLFNYVFPFDYLDRLQVKDQATSVLADCDSLNNHSEGLIWVDGNCTMPLGVSLGSSDNPILLVINDGQFHLSSNANLFGLVLLLQQQSNQIVDIDVMDIANIHGSVISNTALRFSRDRLQIIYDANVLTKLKTLGLLNRISPVAGSWRDF